MGDGTPPITVFRSKPTPADSLTLVALADGSLAILLNGQMLKGCRWRLDQAEQAVTVYRDVLARFQGASAADRPAAK